MAVPSPSHHHFPSPSAPPPHPFLLGDTLQLIDELWFCGNVLRRPGIQEGAIKLAGVADGSEMRERVVKVRGWGCEGDGSSTECEQWKASEEPRDPRRELKAENDEEYRCGILVGEEEVKTPQSGLDQPVGMQQQKQKPMEVKESGEEVESALPPEPKSHQSVTKFKLETIKSGKIFVEEAKTRIPLKRWQRRGWRKRNKSLTDLQYEELKGIRDLGFNLSEDELTPRMVSLVPGLKSYNKQSTKLSSSEAESTRLYPSADWWASEKVPPLQSWKISYSQKEAADMKEQLKFWARAVASTVRQEC